MKILIAEDDQISRGVLEAALVKRGYDVVVTSNGQEAWEVLQREDAPQMAILDWMMPIMDGLEVCRKVRAREGGPFVYIIILTAKGRKEDITTGLGAGGDDYVTKPFNAKELHARVQVGVRIINLQNSLVEHVGKLQDALSRVKQLQGMLPICAYCKKIRNDRNYWQQVENYITEHSEVKFSHGICPECYEKLVEPEFGKLDYQENKAH